MSQTRFVIIGSGRSGSTMLKNLLQSHPHIICFGEVLNQSKMLWDYGDYNEVFNTPQVHEFRAKNPMKFVDILYNCSDDASVRSIGFKSLYNHYDRKKGFFPILEYMLRDDSIKFIHNKRANLFKTYCSYRIASERTKKGMTMNAYRKEDVEREISIEVNPELCLKFIEETLLEEKKFDSLFVAKDSLDVIYEDLARKTGFVMKKVQSFLGVEYKPLRLSTFKVRQKPIQEAVTNYVAVRTYLSDKGFGRFFEE